MFAATISGIQRRSAQLEEPLIRHRKIGGELVENPRILQIVGVRAAAVFHEHHPDLIGSLTEEGSAVGQLGGQQVYRVVQPAKPLTQESRR